MTIIINCKIPPITYMGWCAEKTYCKHAVTWSSVINSHETGTNTAGFPCGLVFCVFYFQKVLEKGVLTYYKLHYILKQFSQDS